MNNIPKVVIIGNIAYDINTFPNRRDKKVVNLGGACLYSAIPASIFYPVGIVSKVGEDFDMKYLKNFNIDTEGVKKVSNQKTTRFYHRILSKDGQEREIVGDVDRKMTILPSDIPYRYFGASNIHIATQEPTAQLELIKEIKRKSNAIISVDTILEFSKDPLLKEVFDLVDIAFIDKEFTNLLDCKAPIKIIKLGKEGCIYVKKDKGFIEKANVIDEVVDKIGAGDCLNGVFINLVGNGIDEKKALRKAVDIATESINDYGMISLYSKHKKQIRER